MIAKMEKNVHPGHAHVPHAHGHTENIGKMQDSLARQEQFMQAAELFRVLSDPTRVRLFWLLCHREECLINLSALLQMSSPALSHHLKEMKAMGLIDSRRMGKEVHYRAADTEVCLLLHPMVEQVLQIACPREDGYDHQDVARRVHDHLVENLDKRLTIDMLSRQFLMNSTTLKMQFKRQYGMSIAAHVEEHRMEKAAELLLSTDDSLSAIAKAVGFSSQSRFAEAFRRHFSLLPSEYRKERRP